MTAYDSFVLAKWFRAGRQGKAVRLLVAHCTVSKEMGTGAEAVANYFKAGTRKASAHAVGDSNSVVGCVKDTDTAFAAAGANNDGWHFEFVGMPDQTADQWDDEFSKAMLHRAAPYWRQRAEMWGIPHRWLTVAEVAAGKAGFCTHHDISRAFPNVSTGHWDPGPEFPKARFLELVNGTTPIPPEDDDVKLIYAMVKSDPEGKVYLASIKSTPRHVKLFADAEYHAALTGDVIAPPPPDPAAWKSITDANGQTRKVLALGDGTLYGL